MRKPHPFKKVFAAFFLLLFFLSCKKEPLPPALENPVILDIPAGASIKRIATLLYQSEIIQSPKIFWMEVKLSGKEKKIKSGEYQFFRHSKDLDVIEMLATGRVYRHRITIREGLTYREIAAILGAEGISDQNLFAQKAIDRNLLTALQIPGTSVEGFLFPSTYFFVRNQPVDSMMREMVANFKNAYTPDLQARAEQLKLSQLEVVTLASIIEKETGQAAERPLISSVFHNRLRGGMRLQSDPTTIYGIENFNGNLTKKHLQTPTPYNTYTIRGLPPGPIANPGKESLVAAVHPATSNFLYFVSRNDGTHIFSSSYTKHNQAVSQFQKKRKNRGK